MLYIFALTLSHLPPPLPRYVDISTVSVSSLRGAISLTQAGGVPTSDSRSLLDSANVVLAARGALLEGAWSEVEAALSRGEERGLHDCAAEECRSLRRECELHKQIREPADPATSRVPHTLSRAAHNQGQALACSKHLHVPQKQRLGEVDASPLARRC